MRISDWSSDVCSSDLDAGLGGRGNPGCQQSAKVRCRLADSASGQLAHHPGYCQAARYADGTGGGDRRSARQHLVCLGTAGAGYRGAFGRSEEHTSELQSLMRISYAVFCLKKKKKYTYV